MLLPLSILLIGFTALGVLCCCVVIPCTSCTTPTQMASFTLVFTGLTNVGCVDCTSLNATFTADNFSNCIWLYQFPGAFCSSTGTAEFGGSAVIEAFLESNGNFHVDILWDVLGTQRSIRFLKVLVGSAPFNCALSAVDIPFSGSTSGANLDCGSGAATCTATGNP